MATNPIFTYDHGNLVVPEELRGSEFLKEGSTLELVSRQGCLVLQPVNGTRRKRSREEVMAAWDSLAGMRPDTRTPEQQAEASARKKRAAANLDKLYSSKTATAIELKAAEREWEFADDALDFGIIDS